MDIEWLQRDLGIYVVNMFDTGQASRVLNFPKFSLAYLLQYYCKVEADKQFQLADWRIRYFLSHHTTNILWHATKRFCFIDMVMYMTPVNYRPLPDELVKYAREDTHYLLYIYNMMKNELIERGNNNNNLLKAVLQRSQQICLKVIKAYCIGISPVKLMTSMSLAG